jgi:hypothetical protein
VSDVFNSILPRSSNRGGVLSGCCCSFLLLFRMDVINGDLARRDPQQVNGREVIKGATVVSYGMDVTGCRTTFDCMFSSR